MRVMLRTLAARLLGERSRALLKRAEYRTKRMFVRAAPGLSRSELTDILQRKLGLKSGDHVFVHASMDNIKADVSPVQLVGLLLEIVGAEGSVTVPTFPATPSEQWMRDPTPFDLRRTPSGMGVFSERVRRWKGARRSLHPTKSVAAIGPIADEIVREHHHSPLPFGPKSPFHKLVRLRAKVVGIGVSMNYLSMVHVAEECSGRAFPIAVNLPDPLAKVCIDDSGNHVNVSTFIHDMSVVVRADPEKFCRRYLSSSAFGICRHWMTPFFVVDAFELYSELCRQADSGHTIYE